MIKSLFKFTSKIYKTLKAEGIYGFVTITKYAKNKIYRCGCIVILLRDLSQKVPSKLTIAVQLRDLTINDIDEIEGLKYLSKQQIENFFKIGSKCLD
jgi:hypothetical protein